jgi:hypothetical protein
VADIVAINQAEQELSNMTPDEILRDRLWGVFRLLELANVEAMHTKRQVALIANTDPQRGGDVDLVPCRFHIDGHHYGALVTGEQQDLILAKISSSMAQTFPGRPQPRQRRPLQLGRSAVP